MFGGFGWRARMHAMHALHGMGGPAGMRGGPWAPAMYGMHAMHGMHGPLGAFFAHWAHGPHGPQHGWQSGWQHGCFGAPTREQMIEHLERYQRDLEEETIAVAAKIKELREAGRQAPAPERPGQQPPSETTMV